MKVIHSNEVSPFGGLNFVIEELDNKALGQVFREYLPTLAPQSTYQWRDLLYSFFSIYLCGGDCIEDLSQNLRSSLVKSPHLKTPSPDRVLDRFRELTEPKELVGTDRASTLHDFCVNKKLSALNLKVCKALKILPNKRVILDFDHTSIANAKADVKKNYKKYTSYNPGVGMIGETIVYVENRNGNTAAQILQDRSFKEMFSILEKAEITIDTLRVDSASFNYEALKIAQKHVKTIFTRPRMNHNLAKDISKIQSWKEIVYQGEKAQRGEILFTPFVRTAKRKHEKTEGLTQYRLIVTKALKKTGQINLFTKDACHYSMIMTNDYEIDIDEAIDFYNQRGAAEKQFDILKNDFGWYRMPFSKIDENTVFLILAALCRNIYQYLISLFSKKFKFLKNSFRVKKFIFRFISIPAKWIRQSGSWVLRIYGQKAFVT